MSYCASDCGQETSWTFARPGPAAVQAQHPRLAVEPDGTVHVLYRDTTQSAWTWTYARCAANCGSEGAWTAAPLPSLFVAGLDNLDVLPGWGRSFAAAGGRLALAVAAERFGTTDSRRGTYVATCAANCLEDASWAFTRVGPQGYESEQHAVVVTPSGGVRVAFATVNPWAELHYAQCEGGCGDAAAWSDVTLGTSAGLVGLALDSRGHPRIAWHGGTAFSFTSSRGGLGYGACEGNCALASSWSLVLLQQGPDGVEGVDLGLTAGDAPVVAYQTKDLGLAVTSCTGNCASTTSVWRTLLLEDPATVSTSLPALLPACPAPTATNPNTPRARWKPGTYTQVAVAGERASVVHVAGILQQCGTSTPTSGPKLLRYAELSAP